MNFIELSDFSSWNTAVHEIHQAEREHLGSYTDPCSAICPVCSNEITCEIAVQGDVREGLHCSHCSSNTRERAVALLLLNSLAVPPECARVHAAEQLSGFFERMYPRFRRLHGGEFGLSFKDWKEKQLWMYKYRRPRQILRVRDITQLGFGTGSLDAQLSQDVLEHVPDYRKALREAVRILKPGGVGVFTVPFYWDERKNARVAWFDHRGDLQFQGEPEYHGDPVSGGALCFHHFGWELLDDMREAGFSSAHAMRVLAPEAGIPQAQWVFLGRR